MSASHFLMEPPFRVESWQRLRSRRSKFAMAYATAKGSLLAAEGTLLATSNSEGWGIEVVSWDRACHNKLRSWAQRVGEYIKLEDYYESVTFMEGTRAPKPIGKHKRGVASPRKVD